MPSVIGIDLSLSSTGIAYPAIGGWETDSYQPKSSGMQRLSDIRGWISDHLDMFAEAVVVVEGYSFSSRNAQAHALGELGGVVRLHMWDCGIPYVDVPPTSRAKFATGRGNAAKSEVVSAVSARTGIAWVGRGADDMCDAWVLQEMGLARLGSPRFEWPAENRKALEKIEWTGCFKEAHEQQEG